MRRAARQKPSVAVVNCGSRKVPEIAAMLDALGAAPFVIQPGELPSIGDRMPDAIVLSGNPALIRDTGTEFLSDYEILHEVDVPVLGICFGHQVIGLLHGAAVSTGPEDRESRSLEILAEHPLFDGLATGAGFVEDHTEEISLPSGFTCLARSSHCENEAMAHPDRPLFGVQCHPEISGENGRRLFANFLDIVASRTPQLRPPRLRQGARIGVVNPAYWLEDERRQRATSVFENLGYKLVPGRSTQLRQDLFAGSPEARAEDIMTMFEDPSIDAMLCARGGYGGNRVLPLLDYDAIRANPKIFIGYSDTTGALASIAQRSGLVTFHGPMLTTFGEQTIDYNLEVLQQVLSGDPGVRIASTAACPARVLKPGIARGPLWGGNLTLVNARLGTPEQIDTRGAILFLEDIDEKLYAFDRMLWHLRASGSLDNIAGLVLGEMLEMSDTAVPFGKDIDAIVLDVCSDFEFPIVSNFPCGHGDYQATLPVSHEVVLDATAADPFILIPESPVS
ncbi:MAG: LD-carboxypeptidase [Gammaproteobacteria bacterium]|nr:LD-carboxypeptidase [Gammaproteobacteria bacterium]MDH5618904.1 LD-carboxypeptidase [Gammaproteobacteria bacterium]